MIFYMLDADVMLLPVLAYIYAVQAYYRFKLYE